jgi:integrase/recombinase XerD
MTTPLPNTPVSPLRQKLIDDMNMRHFSVATQRNYIRDVGRFAAFLRRSPDTATTEDVRQFQLAQSEAGVPVPTLNSIVSALRFFFANTLDRPDLARKLVRVSRPRNLPVVLSRDEVARLLNATTSLKHQAALSVAYGAGLRVGEVAMLKVRDIDSERMLIRVERGKGGQYRNAMLSPDLLALLRQWWQDGHRQGVLHRDGWLFPGQHALKPISTRQLYRVVVEAAQAGEITRCVGPHTYGTPTAQLRHPSARGRCRYPHHPGAARPRQAREHRPLYQGGNAYGAGRHQSARPSGHLRSDRGATRPLSGARRHRGR